jgi:acyl-CoA oxidase
MSTDNDQTRAIKAFRSKASFDSYLMTCLLEGGPDQVQKKRDAWSRVESALGCTDSWKLPSIYGEQTRSEQFEEGLAAGRIMFEDGIKYNHKLFDEYTWKYQMGNALPFGITTVIFLPAIKYLGSEEQSAYWEAKSLNGEIIGAYASTELGGGTIDRPFHQFRPLAPFEIKKLAFLQQILKSIPISINSWRCYFFDRQKSSMSVSSWRF